MLGKCGSNLRIKGRKMTINLNLFNIGAIRLLKTQPVDEELIKEASDSALENFDEVMAKREAEIESKRNKSRLNPAHRNILHGNVPYPESMAPFHETVKYQRKLYARYGSSSGVSPGIMWPTKDDLEDIREYEKVAFPETLKEMLSKMQSQKEKRIAEVKAREEQIMQKYIALGQMKKKLHAKEAQKMAALLAAKEKKDQLVEEVRRHFGYKVDVRDPLFKEMLEKKEKEQKKMAKEAKKKAKEALSLAKLQGMKLVEPEIKQEPKGEEIKQKKTEKDPEYASDSDDEEDTKSRKSKR